MIELAQHYRGWTQRETAAALGRNVHAIVPDSGNPKLDMVVSLSEILDWPIEMVVADLRGKMDSAEERDAAAAGTAAPIGPEEARAIVHRAWELMEAEAWAELIDFSTPERHARLDGEMFAHLMYYRQVALEADGRYVAAVECCRHGLRRVARRSVAALRLRSVLGNALFMAGHLDEAGSVALDLIGLLRGLPETSALRSSLGFALFTRGMALRAQADVEGPDSSETLREARANLKEAEQVFGEYRARGGSPKDESLARKARGAAAEIDVMLHELSPSAFVEEVLAAVESARDLRTIDGWEAETLGWWCVFASRTVTRSPLEFADADRLLAILTNKLDEVAERLGHWALRRHLFTIEHVCRILAGQGKRTAPDWNFDEADIRTLMGTMGRFPEFREVGWQILRAVRNELKERSR
ncbi:MAG TPA: hypothetical protein PKC43_12150 [Phycisphaerales bacterium]|nr:hypothetical protein [Phycisphaerales bacterium]HMP38184.1 hypothetical protein [Phycisphaerales bacterium]